MQFPVPFGSEQLTPCWLQSMWGLREGKGGKRGGKRVGKSQLPAGDPRARDVQNEREMGAGREGKGEGR